MLVIGGYNSSNTCNLARICAEKVPTFHIADPDGLISRDEIRHRPSASLTFYDFFTAFRTVADLRDSARQYIPAPIPPMDAAVS